MDKLEKIIEIPEGYEARIEGGKVILEPKESEDEWIRKHIIEILVRLSPSHWDGNEKAMCIAYLEKLKEQNSSEWVYRPLPGASFDDAAQKAIKYAQNGENIVFSFNGFYYKIEEHTTLDELRKEYDAFGKRQAVTEWSKEDEERLNRIIYVLDRLGFEEYCKSSRDQDVEEERLYYDEIQLLKKLKSFCPQPKQEWSKEDERNLTDAISAIEHLKNDCDWGYLGVGNDIDNVLNFLGSLPQRFNLQPK